MNWTQQLVATNAALSLAFFAACSPLEPQSEPKPARQTEVTFNRDIAPIVFLHCSGCHRPGESAPFSLLGYEDVKRRASQVAEVTRTRFMPPWLPVPGHADFQDTRRLTDQEIQRIQRWVELGTPEGDSADLPRQPTWTDGWRLG